MTLYTSKVIAQWLCLTERRVRQLRDEGVIVEARPGLYELQPTVARYIKYLGGAGKESLNTERMKLTAEKRKAAEMDNDLRRGDEVVTIVVNNLLEIVFAVLGASFTALVIPWLKDTGLPWLKEKRLYSIVKKFVEAAEKQAEAGTIDKATKKRFVVELLEANGITVTPEIDAFIEAAVKELDLAEKNAIGEIGKIFSDAEQTPQN